MCLEVLPKIYLSNKEKVFCLVRTLCLDHFMIVLMMISGALLLQNYILVDNCDVNIKFLPKYNIQANEKLTKVKEK